MKILCTADWHLRGDRPRCRIDDDWLESQRKSISNVRRIFEERNCDQMWILGDLFHTSYISGSPTVASSVLNMAISELLKFPSGSIRILAGNHDLLYHNTCNLEKCAIGTILKMFRGIPDTVAGIPVTAESFGDDPEVIETPVWCTHQLVFRDESERPVEDAGSTAHEILSRNPKAQVVITGDYHHGYIYMEDGRTVVTPGCLNVQVADMKEYRPKVFVLDFQPSEDVDVDEVFLDCDPSLVVDDYLIEEAKNDKALEECVATISSSSDCSLDFEGNLEVAVKSRGESVITMYEQIKNEVKQ